MSRSQNLRHNVINQVIDDMARGHGDAANLLI